MTLPVLEAGLTLAVIVTVGLVEGFKDELRMVVVAAVRTLCPTVAEVLAAYVGPTSLMLPPLYVACR